jgi:hypothetical protein
VELQAFQGIVPFDVLESRSEGAGPHDADDRNRDEFRLRFAREDDPAGAAGFTPQAAFALKRLKVVKGAYGAACAYPGGNFPQGGGVAVPINVSCYEFKDLLLTGSKLFHGNSGLYRMICIPFDILLKRQEVK